MRKVAGHRSAHHPAHQRKHWNQAEQLHYFTEMREVVFAFEAMREEIDAAAAILEHHRAAFETLEADTQALIEHSHRLFADARFIPFHYTADEVQLAFEAVGHPDTSMLNFDQSTNRLIAALRYVLAHRQDQPIVAHKLMMMLPEYVAEQRFMDAWIILHSARVMMDTPCQNNPFVFEMFLYGNDALTERIAVQQEALLQYLGLGQETVYAMSSDEIEAFTQAYLADPAQNAAMVPEIFTPERIARLRPAFQNYQRHFIQAGDNWAAVLARTAAEMLRDVECPGGSRLLLSVCYVSLHETLLRTWAEAWGLSEQDWKGEE